jgi:hypothetical protein
MPVVVYDMNYANQLKLKLLENSEVSISFHAYQCIQNSVSGKKFVFDLTTQFTSRQFDMPDFVVVLFQTNRDGNQERDSSNFDHHRLRNTQFKNSRNQVFPQET